MSDLIRPQIDRGSMRASDADRQLVEEVLNTAYVDGRLSKDELDERLGQVNAARTFNDLAPLTRDLVLGAVTTQYESSQGNRPDGQHAVLDTTNPASDTDQISVILGDSKRTDLWRMHANTSVNAFLGDVTLDLRKAVLESPSLHLTVNSFLADVKVIVPEGVRVVNKINPVLGESTMKGFGTESPNPVATLTLTGTIVLSDVSVRGPEYQTFGDKLLGRKKKG
ncbi:DUF1707 SHOCT-like domain-containing protein [Propionibacteriaceae bacterium G1746]|uniref:DUF1707 SHOCT-like domain-containing protein n=1 Tax=Aestuariimicrobium sp. G57 TaxID=3418485 RepID=UPI003C221421